MLVRVTEDDIEEVRRDTRAGKAVLLFDYKEKRGRESFAPCDLLGLVVRKGLAPSDVNPYAWQTY